MHSRDALEGKIVVHHGEHTLLHLTAVPCVEDDLLLAGYIECNASVAPEAKFLVVLNPCLGSAVDDEVRLLVEFGLGLGTDEHIGHEMSLPCNLHNETNLHAGILVGAAESVDDKESLAGKLLEREFLDLFPNFLGHLVVVVGIAFSSPPYFSGSTFFGSLVIDNVFVLRRTAGEDTGHDVDSTKFGYLSLVIAFEAGFGLFVVENFVGRVVKNFFYALDSVLGQIDLCHK